MSITTNQIQDILGSNGNVVSTSGDKIGSIGQIYLDDSTGDPAWVTVKTGLFGTSQSFVPLDGASLSGHDIQVGYDKEKVKDAPRIDDDGKLSPEEESTLYSYYGVGGYDTDTTDRVGTDYDGSADAGADGGADSGANLGTVGRDTTTTDRVSTDYDGSADAGADGGADSGAEYATGRTDTDRATVGHDTSGPTTDDAMTLSEEQVNVGTRTEESGRARLRKYVVTEEVTQTVPVSHEEVRLEREPITEGNVGDATSGPDISEEEHEVILHAERPVVEKEAVPVERVRLETETVTDNVEVSEEVRKERVDTDTDSGIDTDRGIGDGTTRR